MKWCACAIAAVGALTICGLRLHLSLAAASFCFMLLVVFQSLAGDLLSSVFVSILAVACLDYFFALPSFSFMVESPLEILGLVSFLITALIITHLVTRVRAGNELYRLQQEKLRLLYELAHKLLALDPATAEGSRFLEPFCGVFGIKAACLLDAGNAEVYMTGGAPEELEERTGDAFLHGNDNDDREKGFSVRCICVRGRRTGAIGFEGLEDPELTAGPLAALAAANLERTHSFAHASQAAATAQTESYRSAILDALAHEFKTPLSTILTAAGAIREGGPLGPLQREMAETVESEAARLGSLTSRLIRTARLEREEVKPWLELIDLPSVLADTMAQYNRMEADRHILLVSECESSEVMADPELLRLAVSQLLDNACKYSLTGSTVTLRISRENGSIALRILSVGNPIPPGERSRIFDRFYRGIDGRSAGPGTGLGLYVARKIALALGGNLELDNELGTANGAAFKLTLPVTSNERDAVVSAV